MNEEALKLLYDSYAKDKGFKDYDEFKGLIADDDARKLFFEDSNNDLGFKDQSDFEDTIGFKKKADTWKKSALEQMLPSWQSKSGSQSPSEGAATAVEKTSTQEESQGKKGSLVGVNDSETAVNIWAYNSELAANKNKPSGPVISKAYEDEFNGVVKQKVDSLNSVYGARLESQLSAAKKNIEGNIKSGKVTPEEADQLLSQLNQEYTDKANSDFSNDANSEYDKVIKSYEDKTKKKIEKDSRLAAEKSVKDKNRKPFRDAGMTEDQIDQLEGMVKKRNETGEDDSAITKFISGFGVKAADILFNAAPMSNAAVSNMFMNDFYEQKKEDIKKNLTGKNAGSIDPTNLARINNKNYKEKLEQLMLNDIVLSPKDEAVRDALQMVYETIGSTGADKSQDLFEDNFETFYNKVISNKKLANNEEIRKQQSESVELLGNIPKSWDEAKETGEWAKYVGGAMGNFAGSAAYGVGTLGAGIYTLNTGEVYNTIMENLSKDISEKTGQKMTKDDLILSGLDGDALGTAKAVGVMVSALDAGGLFMGAGRVATGAFKKKIVDTAIKDFIKRGSKSIALRAASQFAKETAIPLVSEAATEMAQSYIPAVASNILAAKIRAGQSFDESIMSLSPEETQEVLESGIQAIIGMGAVAPVGGTAAAFRSVEADIIENDRSEKFEIIKDKNGNQFIISKEKPTTKIVKKEDGTLTSIVSEGNKPEVSQPVTPKEEKQKSTSDQSDIIAKAIEEGQAHELTPELAEQYATGKDKSMAKLGKVTSNLYKAIGKIKSIPPRVVLLSDNESAKSVAASLGFDVKSDDKINGWYNRDTNTMFVTPNTNTAIHEIMMHPVIDALKQTSPERYEEFIQQVAQLKTKDKDGNETTFLDKAKKNYEGSSAEVINEEAVVDYLSGIADKGFDGNFLQKIVELFEKYFNVKVGEFNINLDNPTDVQIFAKDLTKALRQSRPVVLTKDQTVPASARVQIDDVKSKKREGVTFNPDFSEYTGEDDVVTIASENVKESDLTPERINEFKVKHQESLKEKNVKIGIFDMGDGNYSIDLNVTQPFERQEKTKEFAKRNNQKAIYSPKGGGVIEMGGTGETTIKSPSEAAETIKKLNSGNNPSSVNNKNTDNPSDPAVKFQIELFHSSPYRFNEFKSSQVGKGVGKQMLGWGFYFLDKEAPTKVYATSSFQGRVLPKYTGKYKAGNIDIASRLRGEFYGDVGLYKAKLEKESGKLFGSKSAKEEMNQLNKLSEELDRDSVGRFTYNTTAHKGKSPSEYDYLEGGSNLTDAQVHKIGFDTSTTGHQAYDSLAKSLGGDKEASMYLLERGIDGIKYSDGNIFANKDRSKGNNVYVVFDERAISIDRAISFSKTNEYKDNSSKTQEFFSDVVTGKSDKFKPVKPYGPIMKNNKDQEEFNKEYSKFKGNFDEHIATSIPGFRDVQVKKGRAIIDTLPEGGLVIDIAGSEGGLNKSITKISNGKIKTINLDVNKDMQSAHNTNPVKGAEFKLGAFFNDYEEDGFTAKRWIPENKADIVHESMGFQFMSPQRELHIKEAKDNYLKPDGMLIVEEKVGNPQWEENEIKKDIDFKSRFYTKEQIEEKNKAVKVSDFDANEGMAGNMVTEEKLLRDLGDNFSHVQQYWDAGNFKGYVASNDKTKIDKFIKSIGSTNTEFSNRSDDQLKSISFSKDRVSSPELLSIKDQYNTDNKVTTSQVDPNGVFTPEDIKRVEKLHRESKDDRTSDEVLDTYKAFMDETMEMYNTLIDNGYKIEPWTKPGEPYGVNSDLVRKDINENKHLYYLRSKAATGANEQSSLDDSYPLFRETGIVINGDPVLYNDLFRAVHDIFGHGIYKNSFSTQGEFKAYQAHSNMYTEAAQSALFLETVSYNAYYSVNKEYAPRKMYVVPDSIIKPIRESAPAKSNTSFSQEKGAERRSNPVSFQAEKLIGAEIQSAKPITNTASVAKFLNSWAKKNNIFGRKNIDKMDDNKAVDILVPQIRKELQAWDEFMASDYRGFYDQDVAVDVDDRLKKFAQDKYKRQLSDQEVALYHVLSAFASPSATPEFDSQKGLLLFDRYLRTGEVAPYDFSKDADVYQKNEKGINVPTGEKKKNPDGSPVYPRVSVAYASQSLDKFNEIVEKVGGPDNAIDWISSQHSYEELSEMAGKPTKGKDAMKEHEYLSKEEGGYGVFAISGPKLGSYILNRIGNLETVTKDMWYARSMARLFGEPLVDGKTAIKKPWEPSTKIGNKKRTIADKAFKILADERGVSPAVIQQQLWDFEKKLWQQLGANDVSKPVTALSGINKGIDQVYSDRGLISKAERVERDNLPTAKPLANAPFSKEKVHTDVVNGFYSPLEKIIGESKQDKMPAKQWSDKFARGEEAKWTGLSDWLSKQPGSVSKSDIQRYLKDNRISIIEVERGGGVSESEIDTFLEDEVGEGMTRQEARDYLSNDEENLQTKFENYQTPGEKDNYKEILVTMPRDAKYEYTDAQILDKAKSEGFTYEYTTSDKIIISKDGELWDQVSQKDKMIAMFRNRFKDGLIEKMPQNFKSSHFDEPNILVHLRMNTRNSEGNKVLFLEEVQSDWGQKGKKEGFIGNVVKPIIEAKERTKGRWDIYTDGTFRGTFDGATKENAITKAENGLAIRSKNISGGYPQAPFVTDTNSWVKLGLKVALKEAVAQEADMIAWTTGEQQNERYNLSKQVSRVAWSPSKDDDNMVKPGYYDVSVWSIENAPIKDAEEFSERDLEDNFGKDLAAKIIKEKKGDLSGRNLSFGGKGMKGFYGSPTEGSLGIVGNVAKSLFKQEIGTTTISSRGAINPKGDFPAEYKKFASEMEAKYGDEWRQIMSAPDREKANKLLTATPEVKFTQHSIIVTPELEATVKEGQALFSKEKVTKTTERVVAPENSEFENLHNAFDASNPDPRFTGKSQETKKMLDKMSSMTDDEISQEAQKMGSDKLLDLAKSFQGNQNFSLLFLIEQMKRAARANDNAAVDNTWDAVNQIGHTVGQLLAQMRALQSAADNNQIIKRIIDRVFKKAGVNLTNDQKAELSDLVEKYVITAAEEKKQYERYDVNRTPVNKGRLDKSRQNARAAAEDLQIFIDDHVPETLMDTLGALLRGNLLSPISLGRNVFGNTISMVTSFTEAGIVYPMAAKLASPRNARFLPYWVPVMAGASGGWTTLKTLFPSVFDAYFGTHFLPTDDIISNKFEIRRQLRPLRSAKKLFTTLPREIRSGEKSVPQGLKEGLQNLLYATAGIPASLMFKALQATDAPFAEGFKAYHDYIEFYSQKKNAGKSISNLEDFQRNLTESQKSSRAKFARTGLFSDPDSFAAKAARKIITQTPQEITRYTSENFPRFIAEPFNAALLFFRDAMAPYTTVPSNVVWTLMEYAVPALPLIESIQQFKKGNKVLASQLMGRAMNGVAMYYTAALIMEAGLMIDGDDDRKEKNDKQLKFAVGQPYGLNVDGLARLVSGGDPARLPTDRIVDSRMLGQPGLFMAYYSNYSRKLKESGIDERPADFIQDSVDKITIGASEGTRLALDMSFMMGIETALTSLFNVDQEAKGIGYFPGLASQTLDTYSNAIWPNTVSQAIIGSQNQGPLSISRDSFAKNLSERVAKKHFFFMSPDDLYPTLDIWGNKIENKEGIKSMVNLWKSRTQRDPQAWEVLRLMDSTGEENPIYIATPSIEVDTEEGKVRLNLQDSDKFLLASLSGRFTHMLISAAMNDPQYADLTDAERVVVIKDQNTEGRRIARDIFEGLFMNDIEDGKITITDKKKGSYERSEKSTPAARQKQSDEIINDAN